MFFQIEKLIKKINIFAMFFDLIKYQLAFSKLLKQTFTLKNSYSRILLVWDRKKIRYQDLFKVILQIIKKTKHLHVVIRNKEKLAGSLSHYVHYYEFEEFWPNKTSTEIYNIENKIKDSWAKYIFDDKKEPNLFEFINSTLYARIYEKIAMHILITNKMIDKVKPEYIIYFGEWQLNNDIFYKLASQRGIQIWPKKMESKSLSILKVRYSIVFTIFYGIALFLSMSFRILAQIVESLIHKAVRCHNLKISCQALPVIFVGAHDSLHMFRVLKASVINQVINAGLPIGVFLLKGPGNHFKTRLKILSSPVCSKMIVVNPAYSSFYRLVNHFPHFFRVSLTCYKHILNRGFIIRLAKVDIDIFRYCKSIAITITHNILQIQEIKDTTISWCENKGSSVKKIIFDMPVSYEGYVPAWVMRNYDIKTYHQIHGLIGTVLTYRSSVDELLTWGVFDANLMRKFSEDKVILGGFYAFHSPTFVGNNHWSFHLRDKAKPLKILVATSNLLNINGKVDINYSRYIQRFLFAISDAFREMNRIGFEFLVKLRSHPLESKILLSRIIKKLNMPISMSSDNLSTDIHNSDIVITVYSSLIIDSLMFKKPIFIYNLPIYDQNTLFGYLPSERLFSTADELVEKLGDLLRKQKNALVFEQQLFRRYFGNHFKTSCIGEEILKST